MGAIVYCVGVKEFNQTQVRATERWCHKKIILFLVSFIQFCLCVSFLACNYCRLCRACVSCMGRFPSSKGNHRLGMTYTAHIFINTHPYREGDTQIYVVSPSCLVTLSILFFFSFQIIKKSCIEILAAEPSSVCAGGEKCEERGVSSPPCWLFWDVCDCVR